MTNNPCYAANIQAGDVTFNMSEFNISRMGTPLLDCRLMGGCPQPRVALLRECMEGR